MNPSGEVIERLQGQRFTSLQICDATVLQLPGAQSLDCFGAVAVWFERDALLLRSSLRHGKPRLGELLNGAISHEPFLSICSVEEGCWLMQAIGQQWRILPVTDFEMVRVVTGQREMHVGIATGKTLWITYCGDLDGGWMLGKRSAALLPTVIDLDSPNTAFGWLLPASPHPIRWDGADWQDLATAWAVSRKRTPVTKHAPLFKQMFCARLFQHPNLLRRFAVLSYPIRSRAHPWVAEQIEAIRQAASP